MSSAPDGNVLDCGHPDPTPDTSHIRHHDKCWGIGWDGHCDCPHVCADCCPTCRRGEA